MNEQLSPLRCIVTAKAMAEISTECEIVEPDADDHTHACARMLNLVKCALGFQSFCHSWSTLSSQPRSLPANPFNMMELVLSVLINTYNIYVYMFTPANEFSPGCPCFLPVQVSGSILFSGGPSVWLSDFG